MSGASNGHWDCPDVMDSDKNFGFLYVIYDVKNDVSYLGKKQYRSWGKKRSKTYGKEMNWRSYSGSSRHLNDAIKAHGKKNFTFTVLGQFETRSELTYAEVWAQVTLGVLTAKKRNGSRKWYNGQISAIKFIPLADVSPQIKKRIRACK